MSDFLRKRLIALGDLGAVGFAVLTILTLFAPVSHFADVLTSFRHLFVIGAIPVLLVTIAFDRRRLAALTAASLWFNFLLVAPALPHRSDCEPNFTIVTLNALGPDNDVPRTVAQLNAVNADVVVVTELGQALMTELQKQWPHLYARPNQHQAGMGIFSRTPLSNTKAELGAWFHQITAVVSVHGQKITVVGAHPPPPLVENSSQLRNEEIADLAVQMLQIGAPAILAGDFNVTRQSPKFQPLLDVGLVDTRVGHGVAGTWPAKSPFRVGIDHVLHTPDIQTCSIEVGEPMGSDHLPLIARLRL